MRFSPPLVVVALLFSMLSFDLSRAAEDTKSAKKRILLVGHAKDSHPYRTHEYLPDCKLLAKCLRQTSGVETIESEGWPAQPESSKDITAIALYVPWGSNVLFDGPQRDSVKKLLAAGVGLTAIHWSTGAQGEGFGPLWLETLGGWFHTDFSTLQHIDRHLRLVDPAHPICRGLQDFNMFDEYYFHLRFAPGVQPLVEVDLDGKKQTIAWAYERPNSHDGRSFGCVAGHYHKNFGNELFRRFLINGILWTARVDVPPGGSPCKLTEADLALPEPAAE